MKTRSRKVPLCVLLTDLGLCADQQEAERWIMAGRVIVDDHRVDKPGELVPGDAEVHIKGLRKYVGKGGYKLEGALRDLDVSVKEAIVLDTGASTGGFTDCLLQHGAERVYAVDVGYGMLVGKLRNDPRVVVLERTNISDLSPDQLSPQPSLATLDLSYISLQKAIPIVANLLESEGEMICLVKPLFEIADSEPRRTGKIPDAASYSRLLRDLVDFVRKEGLDPVSLTHSRVTGSRGTREFFLRISLKPSEQVRNFDIESIVRRAVELPNENPHYDRHGRGGRDSQPR